MTTLAVLVPAYNEQDTIAEVLRRVLATGVASQVIVVDDASRDQTAAVVEQFAPDVQLIRLESNRGKGAAIRAALPHVTSELVAIQDADLEYHPEDLPALVAPFDDPRVQVVYGSRFLNGRPPMQLPNYIANRLLALATRMLFGGRITDEATCYKLFRTDLLRSFDLACTRFEFCPEVTAKTLLRGLEIVEVPVRYSPRTVAEGKKITWRDGVQALWTLLRHRLSRHRNRQR